MEKKYTIFTISLTLIACILVVYFSGVIGQPSILTGNSKNKISYEKARVINIKSEKLNEDPTVKGLMLGSQEIEVEILSGKYSGQKYSIKNALSRVYNVNAKKDMEVIVGIYLTDNTVSDVSIYSYRRDTVIYFLGLLFFLVILIIGKLKGLKTIVSLIFTVVMIVFFMLPLMFKGVNPIISAMLTASAIIVVTHLLITGWNKKSFSAMIGTILGVIAAGLISYTAGNIAHLSGLTMDNAENLIYVAENSKFSVRGLMFAGILVASLGAVMDVGMSIASSIYEINAINPNLGKKQLFNSGMNVGKDIIGTMANTLILAFTGSSLTIMILIMATGMPYRQMMNYDLICTELIQSLSGSIGIVLTVPLTALISVMLVEYKRMKKVNKIEQKRRIKT